MVEIDDMNIETGRVFLEQIYDHQMQEKIDAWGMHGVDILDTAKVGDTIYSEWYKQKRGEQLRDEIQREDESMKLTKDQIQTVRNTFTAEIDRIMGRRHLRKFNNE